MILCNHQEDRGTVIKEKYLIHGTKWAIGNSKLVDETKILRIKLDITHLFTVLGASL